MELLIRRATGEDKVAWSEMRHGIWPEAPDDDLDFDMDEILNSDQNTVFMGFVDGLPAGLVEVSIREYCDGCETSPVGYIEAWYVCENFRGSGLSRELMLSAEDWTRRKGCAEMGSDTWIDNDPGIRAHLKQGYIEVERLVHFIKPL